MKKIDFLIVGSQKSGTTALDSYLREHIEISMGNKKEIHYFDNENHFLSTPDYDEYHKNFTVNQSHKIVGEATPIYMYWDNAIKRIWQYNSDIKIIIILRNPIERAYSHWNMENQRNNDSLNFSDAIRGEESRIRESLPQQHRIYSYIDRGYYTSQIRKIFQYFSRKQVLILKNEDLKNDLNKTLQNVSSFLEISPFQKQDKKLIHKLEYKTKLLQKDYLFLKNKFYTEIKSLESLLDMNFTSWLHKKKKVLFYRDFHSYSGGHQKVFDYFTHLKQSSDYEPYIYFSKSTLWDKTNPWFNKYKDSYVTSYEPEEYDILFIAGMDWQILEKNIEETMPVINLIQHVRHSYTTHSLFQYLTKKATRITVSAEVTKALEKTLIVNGSIDTIENGHKLNEITLPKIYDVYILGTKNPDLAKELQKSLEILRLSIICTTKNIYREDVFTNMAQAKISILLPNFEEAEGFYLPALESMKYSDITIVPDCIGNRNFCIDNLNCLMPLYTQTDILDKVEKGLVLLNNKDRLFQLKKEALKTVNNHTLELEKHKFLKILTEVLQDA